MIPSRCHTNHTKTTKNPKKAKTACDKWSMSHYLAVTLTQSHQKTKKTRVFDHNMFLTQQTCVFHRNIFQGCWNYDCFVKSAFKPFSLPIPVITNKLLHLPSLSQLVSELFSSCCDCNCGYSFSVTVNCCPPPLPGVTKSPPGGIPIPIPREWV
jgi:hypothetical protein